jgi:hypothetical protein
MWSRFQKCSMHLRQKFSEFMKFVITPLIKIQASDIVSRAPHISQGLQHSLSALVGYCHDGSVIIINSFQVPQTLEDSNDFISLRLREYQGMNYRAFFLSILDVHPGAVHVGWLYIGDSPASIEELLMPFNSSLKDPSMPRLHFRVSSAPERFALTFIDSCSTDVIPEQAVEPGDLIVFSSTSSSRAPSSAKMLLTDNAYTSRREYLGVLERLFVTLSSRSEEKGHLTRLRESFGILSALYHGLICEPATNEGEITRVICLSQLIQLTAKFS